jgi:hypothetical protein
MELTYVDGLGMSRTIEEESDDEDDDNIEESDDEDEDDKQSLTTPVATLNDPPNDSGTYPTWDAEYTKL